MTEKENLEKKLEEIKRDAKRAVQYVKVLRKVDYVTFHALTDSDSFINEFIKPLERSSEWGAEDEKEVEWLASRFKQETKEVKTLKEKQERLSNLLKIGVVGGSLVTIGIFAAKHFLKKVNGNNTKE